MSKKKEKAASCFTCKRFPDACTMFYSAPFRYCSCYLPPTAKNQFVRKSGRDIR